MVAYASSVLGDPNLAEEAVQDTFCIFCMQVDTTLHHETPRGWLMHTLQNVMRNMQRQRAAMNRLIMRSLQVEHLEELLVYDEEDVDLLYGDLAARADFQLLKRVVLDGCTMLEAALIACLLGAMAVAQAAGVDVLGTIARWTDETFFFVPATSGHPSGTSF